MEQNRNASLDLLRIICMMMVVSLHYFAWGGVCNGSNTTAFNYILSNTLCVVCRVGVDCFFMLSGFFLTATEREQCFTSTFRRVFKIWIKVFCFSLLISSTFVAIGRVPISCELVCNALFPVMRNQYWFITVFILISSIRPLLARGLYNMTVKEISSILLFLFFFDCIQTSLGTNAFKEFGAGYLHAFFCVVLGYAIKAIPTFSICKQKSTLLFVIGILLAGATAFVEKKYLHREDSVAVMYNSPLIVIAAFAFFNFFKGLSIKSKAVTTVAPYVLGIYLVNDHPLMRRYFWEDVLHCSTFYDSNLMLLHYAACIVGFIIIGLILDFVISMFIDRVINKRIFKNEISAV